LSSFIDSVLFFVFCFLFFVFCRIKDYNVEISSQKSELTALRVKVDDAQAQLAAAHCEADTQSSQLSKLMARHDELVQTQQTVDTDRCQIQEQIRAVLLYCGQTPTPPIDPSIAKSELEHSTSVSADETMRRVTEKVGEEARSRLMETRSGLAPCTVEGDIATTDSSLQSIRARIDEYAKAKHDIEEQIEEQHRATHGVHQQYALEKHQLAQAQAGVRQVCGQYGVLLQELEDQVEQYKQQRHVAEHVLRECSFALEVAVDTMNQKVCVTITTICVCVLFSVTIINL
jgi:chromosome segregation ATPase